MSITLSTCSCYVTDCVGISVLGWKADLEVAEFRRHPLPGGPSLSPTRHSQQYSGPDGTVLLAAADTASASNSPRRGSRLPTQQHPVIRGSGINPTCGMDWKRLSCRLPYLAVIFILLLLLLGSVAGLRQWKIEDASKIGKAQAFAIFFKFSTSKTAMIAGSTFKDVPCIHCSILSQLMQGIDIDVRALQPYVLLSRNEGASAEDSICLDDISMNSMVAMVRAICSRHWLVLFSTAAATISSMVCPIVSSLLFSPEGEEPPYSFSTNNGAAVTAIVFATAYLMSLALLMVQCSRSDTRLRNSPYSMHELAALAREDNFRQLWARFPPSVTSATLHRNIAGLRLRIDHDAPQPCFKILSADRVKDAGRIWDDKDCMPASSPPPSGWHKYIFWTRNPRQPFVFQTGLLLSLTIFLFPGVWTGLKFAELELDVDFDVSRVGGALIGTGLKLYAERMDLGKTHTSRPRLLLRMIWG